MTQDSLDSKVHGANMGANWVLSASDGPHVGPVNFGLVMVLTSANATYQHFSAHFLYFLFLHELNNTPTVGKPNVLPRPKLLLL